jgi:hypothetical protein
MAGEYTFEDVTAESLDAAAARLLGQVEDRPEVDDAAHGAESPEQESVPAEGPGTEPESEEEDVPAEPAGEPQAPEAPVETQGFTGYRFDDLGVTVDEATARLYAETDARLRNDPAFLQAFQTALGIQPQSEPQQQGQVAGEPPDPYDDPQGFVSWVQAQAQSKVLEQLTPQLQRVEAHEQYINQQNQATARAIVESVISSFKADKDLSDQDISEIRAVAQVKPGGDPYQQVRDAFEVAYWSIPRFREKAMGQAKAEWEADRKRQKKLAAVTGNSGSVPRTPPEPRNVDERKAGLRAAIEELWRGNAINE